MRCVLGWLKSKEALALCPSKNYDYLYNLNMYKKAYIELLPRVNLYDFVWKRL